MDTSKADIQRWARAQELAGQRITHEARQETLPFDLALERVDDLRRAADALGATVDPRRNEEENLAFHLTWARVRRAFDLG